MEFELIVSTLGPTITVIVATISLAYWLGRKFATINGKFKLIDERFEFINERFRQVDAKFDDVSKRLELIEKRLELMNEGFKSIDERFKSVDERFGKLEKKFTVFTEALTKASIEAHSVFADFMGIKGLVNSRESKFLKDRVKGIFMVYTSTIRANPLTKEELEFILKVFSKPLDEITIEEMNRAYEIGKRLYSKDFDERGFLLAVAAAYIRAYLRQKKYEEEKEK